MNKLNFKNIQIMKDFAYFSSDSLIFYSLYIWVKTAMDLWIEDNIFQDFVNFCKKHHIYLKYDIKFVESSDDTLYKKVIWSENLTTTKTIWESIVSTNKWRLHCFISMNQISVENLYKYWWYPIVVWNRVIYKNFHDLSEFGKYLWYPSCCTEFFFKKNDWRFYNFPYEIYKNSQIYDYRCNPFWKDYFWISYIYHMPCNFWCKDTIEYVQKIIYELEKQEPEMVFLIETYLLYPILCMREQKMYAFQWEVSENNTIIQYSQYFHLWHKSELDLSLYLDQGNNIKIEWNFINIYLNEKKIFSYNYSFSDEIEIPFIIQFKKYPYV